MHIDAKIPLFNPKRELDYCKNEILSAINKVVFSGSYINGLLVQQVERQISTRCHGFLAIGVSSGTMSLELMLQAVGVGKGTKVVTSASTFVAVIEAILRVGAKPHFVDIEPNSWQMPAGSWNDAAVIVCHMYGGASLAVNSKARWILEDASQSFGATYNSKMLGTFGLASAISMYPTKNLGALGDAGLVLTTDENIANKIRAMRNHGQTSHQEHIMSGTTGRLDELQAAILNEKLRFFEQFLDARRQAATYYRQGLVNLPIQMPETNANVVEAPNLFVVSTPCRDQLRDFLASRGIATGIHYPKPIHLMSAYQKFRWAKVNLPHSERLSKEILSLPLWAGISPNEQETVVAAIADFFHTSA